ncbi:energy-coupling factor ABC transporter substrate-binding protein [Tepidibacillus sp. LV47]|uniref:energy-coupling factor ABC transporter substrate-binding protein n=1 Tax=Tepidibacillus sp. LV47 TaxID=3398228 RepID=UPI003AB06E63
MISKNCKFFYKKKGGFLLGVNKKILLSVFVLFLILFLQNFLGNLEFTGTDDQAQGVISTIDRDYQPWITNLFFEPNETMEKILFSVQAILGFGVLIYGIGFYQRKDNDR